jgi:hypothetical protein
MQEFVLTRPFRRDVGDLDDPGPVLELGRHRCEDRVFNGWLDQGGHMTIGSARRRDERVRGR